MLTESGNDTWCAAVSRVAGACQRKPVPFNITNADVVIGIANIERDNPERLLGVYVSRPEQQKSKSLGKHLGSGEWRKSECGEKRTSVTT